MKHLISNIAAVFILFTTWGCSDWLDINTDPNALADIPDPKVLLPAAEINLANTLMGWDLGFGGGFFVEYWTQHYTASQFKALCEYQPANYSTAYRNMTSGVLKDLDVIRKKSADNENRAFYYIAEALSIYTWQILTDTWGNIPYSEALKGDEGIQGPKFDSGESIYADLLKRVDDLYATDLSGSYVPDADTKYDFIFAGDLEKWQLFVNSLKLKLMMRLSETTEYNNGAVLSFIENNEFLTTESARISGAVWSDGEEGKRHPMREFQAGGASYLSTNVIAAKNFVDYLFVNNDPRLPKLFTAVGGVYRGAFFGDFDSRMDSDDNGTTDDKESYSQAVFAGNMDIMIISHWETNFYIAEVYARAGNAGKAQEYYEQGVQASLAQHGIADKLILEENGYAKWTGGSTEEMLHRIGMQKWVAHAYYQHTEAFLERNRTKYPPVNDIDIKLDRRNAFANFPVGYLTISVNGRSRSNATLPASPIYPDNVLTRNPNAPSQKDDLFQKIWWDKKSGK
ncbi:MAG TPA: SusD/RagB family nutrient-binding outer membrane lipoprotein [Porphyromonadaceae bacterium]|nr:SusD/RagB family nutrient-binding outer membrane lipoprotein [Porphyromonadaceae bacterium]